LSPAGYFFSSKRVPKPLPPSRVVRPDLEGDPAAVAALAVPAIFRRPVEVPCFVDDQAGIRFGAVRAVLLGTEAVEHALRPEARLDLEDHALAMHAAEGGGCVKVSDNVHGQPGERRLAIGAAALGALWAEAVEDRLVPVSAAGIEAQRENHPDIVGPAE